MGNHMFTAVDALRHCVRMRKHMVDLPDRNTPVGHSAKEVCDFDFFNFNIRSIIADSRRPELTSSQLILSLNDLMIETSNFQATDSRDRLYGLLGLLPSGINQLVRPDYTKSMITVFVDFALLTYEGRFGMIAQSGIGHAHSCQQQTSCPDMPSWVPSYRGQFIEYPLLSFIQRRLGSSRFKAGGSNPPRWCRVPRTLTLRVSGVRAGNITAVCAPEILLDARVVTWACYAATMRDGDHPCRNWRREFYQTLLLDQNRQIVIPSNAQDGEEAVASQYKVVLEEKYLSLMQSAFKHFSSQDRRSPIEQATSTEKLHTHREEYQYWLEGNVSVQVRDLHDGDEPRPSFAPTRPTTIDEIVTSLTRNNFVSELDRMTKERSFMMIDNGYMGLAPVGTEVGDEVVLLLGCPVPLVLRRQADKFQVIGDTYIYGLMEGQVFERIGAGLAHIEDLVLQ
ncbi:uncharacterized protein PAC_12972 [Phialocephala subalpina]|uniref:Heterokaryon incompatibility domain-containing protein n=1 Tax=Phialocephala subalpina TaxID=576137 RepID=A0A1L7XDG4_9HELO|nr:uncharacterized protein PAC_12972 [Phialocephala subalpina]